MVKCKLKRGNKYNSGERIIARKIYDLKNVQRYFSNRLNDIGIEIGLLKKKLNGKYQDNSKSQLGPISMVPKKEVKSCSLGEHKNHAHAHAQSKKEGEDVLNTPILA
ncbi:MAG TPA: hypothetical protein ENI23_15505 [bacterium]|nr:hypothetical protein [bacterium]